MKKSMTRLVAILGMLLGAADPGVAEDVAISSREKTAYPGGKWEPGPAQYGSLVVENVPVTMDDGVVLRAKIAYPADRATGKPAAGTFPVVIEHTPYVTLGNPVEPLGFFPEHGYIYALVQARGGGASGGELQYLAPRDGQDGKAIVNWAAHQLDGSDGRLALVGCSYPAGMAMVDAAALGPGSPVKAIVAACNGFHSQNRGSFMRAGFMTSNIGSLGPRLSGLLGSTPSSARLFKDAAHSIHAGGEVAYDRSFWRDRLSTDRAAAIVASGIPVLLWSGWQDHVEGAVRTYTALQNVQAGRDPGLPMTIEQPITPRYQLLMGDWAHAKGLDLGIYLQWIDTWMNDADTAMQSTTTPMHLFEVGTNRWVNLARFPSAERATKFYLNASGTLDDQSPVQQAQQMLARQDPATAGGSIRFETQAMQKGATLSGPISVTVHASSSKRDLELVARLFDIGPDGTVVEITTGSVLGSLSELDERMSWRDTAGTLIWPWPKLEQDKYLTPDKPYRFDVSLLSRQWGVLPGHRLRLELAGQAPPAFCGKDSRQQAGRTAGMFPCELTSPQEMSLSDASYRIFSGGETPSSLNLPLLPFGTFATVPSGATPTAYDEGERRLKPSEETLPLDWGTR